MSLKTQKKTSLRQEKLDEAELMFVDKKIPKNPDDIWDSLLDFQKEIKAQDSEQDNVSVNLKSNKPIALAFFGDWHIGSRGTDYGLLREHVSILAETNGLYVFTTGDEFDNYILNSPKGGKNEAILPPEYQKALALSIAKKLKGKIIASVFGCHTNWSRESDDYNWVKHATEKSGAANLGYGGRTYVEIGKQTYIIDIRHKFSFNSSLNSTNTYMRYVTMKGVPDIIGFAHFHHPFVASQVIQGKPVYFLRSGSYKIEDRYAARLGGYKGVPGVPICIVYPDKFQIEPHANIDIAIKRLADLRR